MLENRHANRIESINTLIDTRQGCEFSASFTSNLLERVIILLIFSIKVTRASRTAGYSESVNLLKL